MESGRRCITHDLWDELGRHIHLFLNGVTLEDVIERRVLGMSTTIDQASMLDQAAE
jgi:Rrf2 family iron-sulfur cluster assembly transcriptional regulator